MMKHTDERALETTAGASGKGMAAIVRRLNAIGDNPLCRNEVVALRRAYTAAVVRYFDHRRMAAGLGYRLKVADAIGVDGERVIGD